MPRTPPRPEHFVTRKNRPGPPTCRECGRLEPCYVCGFVDHYSPRSPIADAVKRVARLAPHITAAFAESDFARLRRVASSIALIAHAASGFADVWDFPPNYDIKDVMGVPVFGPAVHAADLAAAECDIAEREDAGRLLVAMNDLLDSMYWYDPSGDAEEVGQSIADC